MELKEGSRVFMDTAPIIYFIEDNSIYMDFISQIFDKIRTRHIEVFTSIITLTEVLTKPYKTGNLDIVAAYKEFFYHSTGFSVVDMNSDIADLTARIRAKYGFKTPE